MSDRRTSNVATATATATVVLISVFALVPAAAIVVEQDEGEEGEESLWYSEIQKQIDEFSSFSIFEKSCLSFLPPSGTGPEVTDRSRRARAFLKSSDLSDAASFSGAATDEHGRPDSDGVLVLFGPGDGGDGDGVDYVRGARDAAGRDSVAQVAGHFVGGKLEGAAKVTYKDGGLAYYCFRHGVRHGPFYRRGGKGDPQVRFNFPHVQEGSESVGAYLDGRPHGRWWERCDQLQTVYHSPAREESSMVIFYGPLRDLGHRAEAYQPSRAGPGGRFRAARRLRLIRDELLQILQVEGMEVEGEESSQVLVPPHLLRAPLSDEDLRLLLVFLHFQPRLHRQFVERHDSFVKDRVRFHDPFGLLGERESLLQHFFHNLTEGHPECQRFARLRVLPKRSVHGTVLVGFPGSGNQWFAELVHLLSGFATERRPCSICDRNVILPTHLSPIEDLDGGLGDANFLRPVPSLAFRLRALRIMGGRMILLFRNPHEAIISWWNHLRTKDASGLGLPPATLKSSLRSREFCRFARAEAALWRLLALDTLSLTSELLVVHYEDMREDPLAQMERALRFLKLPTNKDRFDCVRRFPLPKRRNSGVHLPEEESPFCVEAAEELEEAIQEVDAALRSGGHSPLPVSRYKYYRKKAQTP